MGYIKYDDLNIKICGGTVAGGGTGPGGTVAHDIGDLGDVDFVTVAPQPGQVLSFNGNKWVPVNSGGSQNSDQVPMETPLAFGTGTAPGTQSVQDALEAVKTTLDPLVSGVRYIGAHDMANPLPTTHPSGGPLQDGDFVIADSSGTQGTVTANAGDFIYYHNGGWQVISNQRSKLGDLTDVSAPTPTAGQILQYVAAQGTQGQPGYVPARWEAVTPAASPTPPLPPYDDTSGYAVGDQVTHNNKLWVATSAITAPTGGATTPATDAPGGSADKWAAVGDVPVTTGGAGFVQAAGAPTTQTATTLTVSGVTPGDVDTGELLRIVKNDGSILTLPIQTAAAGTGTDVVLTLPPGQPDLTTVAPIADIAEVHVPVTSGATPVAGQHLVYDGTNWVNQFPTVSGGGELVKQGNGWKLADNPTTTVGDVSVVLKPSGNGPLDDTLYSPVNIIAGTNANPTAGSDHFAVLGIDGGTGGWTASADRSEVTYVGNLHIVRDPGPGQAGTFYTGEHIDEKANLGVVATGTPGLVRIRRFMTMPADTKDFVVGAKIRIEYNGGADTIEGGVITKVNNFNDHGNMGSSVYIEVDYSGTGVDPVALVTPPMTITAGATFEYQVLVRNPASDGQVAKVAPDDLLELKQIIDVDLTTTPPTDGQVISYDAANSKWVPTTAGGGGGGGELVKQGNGYKLNDNPTTSTADGAVNLMLTGDATTQDSTHVSNLNIVEEPDLLTGTMKWYPSDGATQVRQSGADPTQLDVTLQLGTAQKYSIGDTVRFEDAAGKTVTSTVTAVADPVVTVDIDSSTITPGAGGSLSLGKEIEILVRSATPADDGKVQRIKFSDLGITGGGGASDFGDLDDVDFVTVAPTDGQGVAFDSANSEWVPTDLGQLVSEGNGWKLRTNGTTTVGDDSILLKASGDADLDDTIYGPDNLVAGDATLDGTLLKNVTVLASTDPTIKNASRAALIATVNSEIDFSGIKVADKGMISAIIAGDAVHINSTDKVTAMAYNAALASSSSYILGESQYSTHQNTTAISNALVASNNTQINNSSAGASLATAKAAAGPGVTLDWNVLDNTHACALIATNSCALVNANRSIVSGFHNVIQGDVSGLTVEDTFISGQFVSINGASNIGVLGTTNITITAGEKNNVFLGINAKNPTLLPGQTSGAAWSPSEAREEATYVANMHIVRPLETSKVRGWGPASDSRYFDDIIGISMGKNSGGTRAYHGIVFNDLSTARSFFAAGKHWRIVTSTGKFFDVEMVSKDTPRSSPDYRNLVPAFEAYVKPFHQHQHGGAYNNVVEVGQYVFTGGVREGIQGHYHIITDMRAGEWFTKDSAATTGATGEIIGVYTSQMVDAPPLRHERREIVIRDSLAAHDGKLKTVDRKTWAGFVREAFRQNLVDWNEVLPVYDDDSAAKAGGAIKYTHAYPINNIGAGDTQATLGSTAGSIVSWHDVDVNADADYAKWIDVSGTEQATDRPAILVTDTSDEVLVEISGYNSKTFTFKNPTPALPAGASNYVLIRLGVESSEPMMPGSIYVDSGSTVAANKGILRIVQL